MSVNASHNTNQFQFMQWTRWLSFITIPLKAANLDRSRVQNWVQFHIVFGLHHLSKGQYMILTAQHNHVWDMRCYTVNCSKHHIVNITFSFLCHILHPIIAMSFKWTFNNHPPGTPAPESECQWQETWGWFDHWQEIHLILLHLRGVDAFKLKQLNANDIL